MAAEIESPVVRDALELLRSDQDSVDSSSKDKFPRKTLDLDESEWAEELAAIGKRRNILERKTREFIRVALKMGLPNERTWTEAVITSLPQKRREDYEGLSPDSLMGKLYWLDLSSIITREWRIFERFFQDKRRFQDAFRLLNERPDAHAKEVDLADVALQRRELTWLEERISQ